MRKVQVILRVLGFLLSLQTAHAEGVGTSCYVPGFLNFNLGAAAGGVSELRVNQFAYGLAHGPATTLAKSLGLSTSDRMTVRSLVIDQAEAGQEATATFVFSNGSEKQVSFEHLEITVRDGTFTNGGKTYAAKLLKVISEAGLVLDIPAQANLCKVDSAALTPLRALEFNSTVPRGDCDPSNAPPICGHGSYAPRCLCGG